MSEVKIHKISKLELKELNENDLMFITNPGRMGDVDGSTFIIKQGNEFTIYRVDGLMYSKKEKNDIQLEDIKKQFPKWFKAWNHEDEKEYTEKYKYLYMGFGNGLSVDKSIYNEYKQYLDNLVKGFLEDKKDEEKDSLKYAAIFKIWEDAVIDMAKDKGYKLK